MAVDVLHLEAWHNVPFPPTPYVWALDPAGAEPVDLTDRTLAMDVRDPQRELGALISLDMAATGTANGLRVLDAAAGMFRIQIGQTALQSAWNAALAAGLMKAGHPVRLVYDILATDPDGFTEPVCEGDFVLWPGKTLS